RVGRRWAPIVEWRIRVYVSEEEEGCKERLLDEDEHGSVVVIVYDESVLQRRRGARYRGAPALVQRPRRHRMCVAREGAVRRASAVAAPPCPTPSAGVGHPT